MVEALSILCRQIKNYLFTQIINNLMQIDYKVLFTKSLKISLFQTFPNLCKGLQFEFPEI